MLSPHADVDIPSTLPDRLTLPVKNRTIALVHTGLAGGTPLRMQTAVSCMVKFEKTDPQRKTCLNQFSYSHKLAFETRKYFHLKRHSEHEMEESTTFLFPLRNPVDRIVDAFHYSHPENCQAQLAKAAPAAASVQGGDDYQRPSGCDIMDQKLLDNPNTMVYGLWGRCFASPKLEDFAQAALSPYRGNPGFAAQNLTRYQRYQCRKLAVNLVQGSSIALESKAAPHFQHNYEYYAKHTIWQFPHKEVFVIRTDNINEDNSNRNWQQDANALEQLLGGNGNFSSVPLSSAASAKEEEDTLSPDAYKKLCCVLEHEIEIYKDILDKAANLDRYAKEETMDELKSKCGISRHTSWTQWRTECRARLRDDLVKIVKEPKPTDPPTMPPTEAPVRTEDFSNVVGVGGVDGAGVGDAGSSSYGGFQSQQQQYSAPGSPYSSGFQPEQQQQQQQQQQQFATGVGQEGEQMEGSDNDDDDSMGGMGNDTTTGTAGDFAGPQVALDEQEGEGPTAEELVIMNEQEEEHNEENMNTEEEEDEGNQEDEGEGFKKDEDDEAEEKVFDNFNEEEE